MDFSIGGGPGQKHIVGGRWHESQKEKAKDDKRLKGAKKGKCSFRNNTIEVWSPCTRITPGFGTFPRGQHQTFFPFMLEVDREILYVGLLVEPIRGALLQSPI